MKKFKYKNIISASRGEFDWYETNIPAKELDVMNKLEQLDDINFVKSFFEIEDGETKNILAFSDEENLVLFSDKCLNSEGLVKKVANESGWMF